jgi:chemotaxis protein CheX
MSTIVLDSNLDFDAAEPLFTALSAAVAAGKALLIDASCVETMTTPCAQILVSVLQTAAKSGVPLQIAPVSTPFREAISVLGIKCLANLTEH